MKFIESICFKGGSYLNLDLHNDRWTKTHHKFLQSTPPHISKVLPTIRDVGIFKVRLVYDQKAHQVSYSVYEKKDITSLRVVASSPFDYSFKFEDRRKIDKLVRSSNATDIIISFTGLIKDSSYSNLAFWDGKDWFTPEKPLLEGVKRAQLLAEEKIKKAPIHTSDLVSFEKVSLINAMLDLGELEIPMSAVHLAS